MQRIKEELTILEDCGQLRKIPSIDYKKDGIISIDGIEYINYASNDYLGISTKHHLREEFLSTSKSLLSSASARLLTGSSSEFNELEKTIKNLFNKEACLIYNTGYQCNLGVITALIKKGDVIFSDKLNHASIIDGMRLSEGDFIRFRHKDYNQLEDLLSKKRKQYNRAIIVSESVFSMDGDLADIEKLVELKKKYDCLLMIDEAHAFGAIGPYVDGLCHNKDVDIITATFGKAIGSFGAFCVSRNDIIDYLINKSRSFIFSTSIPPINIAWTNWLLTEKIEFIKSRMSELDTKIKEAHKLYPNTISKSQIIPIIIGSNSDTLKLAEKLKAEGFYIPAIRPPTVPEGSARLRISLTADSKIDDFKRVLKIIHEF